MDILLENSQGIVVLVVLVALVAGIVFWSQRGRRAFVREYGKVLPRGAKVQLKQGPPGFELGYSFWQHARKDGCRDGRRGKNNSVVTRPSVLWDGTVKVLLNDPFSMYDLVLTLRKQGREIPLCREEAVKHRHFSQQMTDRRALTDVESLVERFRSRPVDFEDFCAEVFNSLGYRAAATGGGPDGGIDIRMTKNGVSIVVECKLYSNTSIGRPLVQKLVGAQMSEGAERAIFVTTSKYSQQAINYAVQMGVDLIDGPRLIEMYQRGAGGSVELEVPASMVRLGRQDIYANFAPDLQG